MNDIKIFITCYGQKIIAKIRKNKDDGTIFISGAYGLTDIEIEEGSITTIPIRFMDSSDEEIQINPKHIFAYPSTPDKDLLEMYQSLVSNIVTIPKKDDIRLV